MLPVVDSSRRTFLQSSLFGAGLLAAGASSSTAVAAEGSEPWIPDNAMILFQGDSITDAGRSREHPNDANLLAPLGQGYAFLAAANLLTARPDDKLKIFNRGISGNKVHQLAERWQPDCLDLQPDVLSILIGVNDIWHKLNGNYDGTVETYENDYRALLQRTKEALPDVKLVICEPFILICGAVKESWVPEFAGFRAAALELAIEFGAVFVPFQTMFDRAVEYAPPEHWAQDGVHPSPQGASLMAHHWVAAVTAGEPAAPSPA
jgi:lysophospholipase L1-like esterase